MPAPNNLNPDRWSRCRQGDIARVTRRASQMTRRRALKVAGSAAGILTLGGGATGYFLSRRTGQQAPRPVGCRMFIVNMEAYIKRELEPGLMARMHVHAQYCRSCAQRLEIKLSRLNQV